MAQPLRPIERTSWRTRTRNVWVKLAGGAAAGALTPDPATGALAGALSEGVQGIVDELATDGLAANDKATIDEFGAVVTKLAQVVPDSEHQLSEFRYNKGEHPTDFNLYRHAMHQVGERSGAAREAMMLGLAHTVFESAGDVEPSALRRSLETVETLTDDQVSLMALLDGNGQPFSKDGVRIESAGFEEYGAHKDEVILLFYQIKQLIDKGLVCQIEPMNDTETVLAFEMRMEALDQPKALSEIRIDQLTLSQVGSAVARSLGLGHLDGELTEKLRAQLDPNGILLDDDRPNIGPVDGPGIGPSLPGFDDPKLDGGYDPKRDQGL